MTCDDLCIYGFVCVYMLYMAMDVWSWMCVVDMPHQPRSLCSTHHHTKPILSKTPPNHHPPTQDVSSTALVWQPHLAQQHPGLLQLLPQWESLPTLLGAPLTADGLLSPLTCDKVFEVDATSLPDHEKLQRRIDSYVASLEGFRGRAMPLPPVGGAQEEGGEGATGGVGGKGKRGRVLGGEGDVLVSVVLPIKQGEKGGSGGVLRALDRLFVVLLQQSAVYATYSCQLPKLGFM